MAKLTGADDKDLPDLAAHIIGYLQVHIPRNFVNQAALPGQTLAEPAQNAFLVLEEEKRQHRHQHDIDHQRKQAEHGCHGPGQHLLAQRGDLGTDSGTKVADLGCGKQVGVFFRQLQQQSLPECDDIRQLPDQLCHLVGQTRHHPDHDEYQQRHEQQEHQRHREQARHAQFVAFPDQAIQQIGDHHTGKYRRQHLPEGQHDGKTHDQQNRQDHHLGIRDMPVIPLAQNIHALIHLRLT